MNQFIFFLIFSNNFTGIVIMSKLNKYRNTLLNTLYTIFTNTIFK